MFLHYYILLLKTLLSPAEWGNMNDTEVWAYSGFISSSQMKGWSQPNLCRRWKGSGSSPVLAPAVRTRARDGAQGTNVPSQPVRRGMAPWEAARVQSAETRCETALIKLCSCLCKGACPLQLLCVGRGLISMERVGRIEARLVRRGFQSQFVHLCPFSLSGWSWACRRRTESNSASTNFSQDRSSLSFKKKNPLYFHTCRNLVNYQNVLFI